MELAELLHRVVIEHRGSLLIEYDPAVPCIPPLSNPEQTSMQAVVVRGLASGNPDDAFAAHVDVRMNPEQLAKALSEILFGAIEQISTDTCQPGATATTGCADLTAGCGCARGETA